MTRRKYPPSVACLQRAEFRHQLVLPFRFDRAAFWLCMVLIDLPSICGGSAATDFDDRCFEHAEQADRDRCDILDPCRSDCWSNFFTHSYCCVADSLCWWWGVDPGGDIVRTDAAHSGVECRYICQAEPSCRVWVFHLPSAQAGLEAGGACLLLANGEKASRARQGAKPRLVSGPRICPPGHEARPVPMPLTLGSGGIDRFSNDVDTRSHGWVQTAARAVIADGWAVLRGVLSSGQVRLLADAATEAAEEFMKVDPYGYGNRGPRRYSFGGASLTHHMVHIPEWAELLDDDHVSAVLAEVFGGTDAYVAVGGGGDLVLNHTDTHQRLHVDLQHPQMYDVDTPPAAVVANFAVSAVSCDDGPMRLMPRTHQWPLLVAEGATRDAKFERYSSLEREAVLVERVGTEMVNICPLDSGDVLLRDMRIWHGGTPNVGDKTRILPSAEFLAPWYADLVSGTDDHFAPRPSLPFANWWRMSERGKRVSRRIVSAPGPVESGMRQQFELMLPYVAEDRA
eukprot:TRINITY_DN23833_c0_g1_i1.p1 TRINITY_DN23833_c0_g1~~TRINITY_DN23833_c0_g1_i1.p1  ORF type:complete len:511 (-),score=63.85 TRINITY_DN23833_c0_g1_i1:106-1638(-)